MGTIIERPRKDGSTAYMAKIRVTRDGKIAHSETGTFDRRQAAVAWIKRREAELEQPGALERSKTEHITLADAIDRYVTESTKAFGRTKTWTLEAIKKYDIARKRCDQITSHDLVAFAQEIATDRRSPATVNNYMSFLSTIFTLARPAWDYRLDRQALADAMIVLRRLGLIGKSKQRDRRPTLDELDRIMEHFRAASARRPSSVPMTHVVAFAIFSTRRQEEITRIAWTDFEEAHSRVLVRDMKNPGETIGNNVWCDLPEPALQIIKAMPKNDERIFPYTTDAIGAAFTRACQWLEIDDLHFHDLRHEGVSRLFEIGATIPKAAAVSGHRSWTSLKRYTHMREAGDRYAGWKWLELVTAPPPPPRRLLPVRDSTGP